MVTSFTTNYLPLMNEYLCETVFKVPFRKNIYMKKGLVLEGGAMRGLFTCGVIDVMMENNINFDGLVGVSAGAAFGCNYKSKQIGRAARYNIKYCNDKRYTSFRGWMRTGNLFSKDFCHNKIPMELDPYDFREAWDNPMKLYLTCSNIKTGEPEYKEFKEDPLYCLELIRATTALPIFSNIIRVDDEEYLDGGIVDSIPIKFMERQGYTKNIVVLTQIDGFVKEQTSLLPLIKVLYRKYPAFVEKVIGRPQMYNETLAYIKEKEALGEILVIRPPYKIPVKSLERNPENLNLAYELGKTTALEMIDKIKEYLI